MAKLTDACGNVRAHCIGHGEQPNSAICRAMPDYRLPEDAAVDLGEIAAYTIERFGIEQARVYSPNLFEASTG